MLSFFKKYKLFVITSLSFIVAFSLFGHIIKGNFIGDDHVIVQQREDLQSIKNIPSFFISPAFPDKPSIRLYRPLTLTSYAINFLFSDKASGFHIGNLILHSLSVILVFLITYKLLSLRAAIISTVFFMFMPIHTESVIPVVGRSEILSAFFAFLSLFLFFNKKYILSSLFFLCALFSKDFTIFLAPLFGAIALTDERNFWKSLKTGLFFIPSIGIYFLLRYLTLGRYAFAEFLFHPVTAPLAVLNLKERIFTGFLSLFLYIKKSFYPVDLAPDYSFNQIPAVKNLVSSPGAVIGLLIFTLLIFLIFQKRRNLRLSALIILVPFIFISNMLFVTSGSFAERWWYFPSLGLAIIVGLMIEKFLAWKPKIKIPLIFLGTGILTWYTFITIQYSGIWLDDKTYFINVAKRVPNNAWARSNAAAIYLEERKFEDAWREVNASLDIYEKYSAALSIKAQLYWNEANYAGDENFQKAEETFLKAIEYDYAARNARGLYRMLAFLNLDFGYNKKALTYMEKTLQEPLPKIDQRTEKIDNFLYEVVKEFSTRDVRTYTQEEGEELARLIHLIRGF